MSLSEYLEEIESFEFGAQFSVYSGFRLVISDMDENETLQKLVRKLRSDIDRSRILYERVRFLLKNPPLGDQMAFDGSLTSYVYCLWKSDLETGYLASKEVLNSPGLWWSAKLALVVRKKYLDEQISKRVQFKSEKSDPVPYTLTGHEYPSLQNIAKSTNFLVGLEASPETTRRYEYQRALNDRVEIRNLSLESSSGRLVCLDISNPTQEFEISNAI